MPLGHVADEVARTGKWVMHSAQRASNVRSARWLPNLPLVGLLDQRRRRTLLLLLLLLD